LLVTFVWGGSFIFNIANVFDSIIIAAVVQNGLAATAIFSLAQNISSLMQAPQRAVVSAATGPLSQAWKDKDYKKINLIYQRSSINQLIFAIVMFCLIWLNFDDAISTFNFQKDYAAAKWVFFVIGITRIIDMGTGVNSQIIGTSTFWRFEFISGLILLALVLPLNWQLTRYYGIMGPAYSNLISFTVYNAVRYTFLWRRFNMQPFTWKTLWAIILGVLCYVITWVLFRDINGFLPLLLRSIVFLGLFLPGMFLLKLSPDVQPVLATVRKRLKFG
jgi:O-antigen/teichoic acid export membrane protein